MENLPPQSKKNSGLSFDYAPPKIVLGAVRPSVSIGRIRTSGLFGVPHKKVEREELEKVKTVRKIEYEKIRSEKETNLTKNQITFDKVSNYCKIVSLILLFLVGVLSMLVVYIVSFGQLFGFFNYITSIDGWTVLRETIFLFLGAIAGHLIPKGLGWN